MRSVSRSRSSSPVSARRSKYRDEEPPLHHRRRYEPKRSVSPPKRRDYSRDRGLKHSRRGDRARSFTPSDASRSRSPRRPRRRRDASVSSPSHSPPPRRRRASPPIPRSRSRSIEDRRRSARPKRAPSYSTDSDRGGKHADDRKEPPIRDYRPHDRSRSRSPSKVRSVKPTKPVRRSSPSPRRPRKRSIERYVPGARRRRNSSSISSPAEKRRKTADSSADEGTRDRKPELTEPTGSSPERSKTLAPADEVGSDS